MTKFDCHILLCSKNTRNNGFSDLRHPRTVDEAFSHSEKKHNEIQSSLTGLSRCAVDDDR